MTEMSEEIKTPEAEAAEETAEAKDTKKGKKEAKKLEAEVKALAEKNAELEKKLADSEDAKLRLAAEYDNYRRRTQKEREALYNDAFSDAVSGILPIIDNLDYALQYGASEEEKKGIELIIKNASEALAKMGVTEIEALGTTFDPNVHNAVMHVEDETKGESEIVQVLQKGYKIGDKVIRFAMVSVAN